MPFDNFASYGQSASEEGPELYCIPYWFPLNGNSGLTAYPKRQRRNRVFFPEDEELKRQCTDLFKQGLVRVSNSPYVAPIVMVRKPDGSIRVCVDYRALNECIVKDSFPLPRIDDLLDKLRSAECMTHLDLRSAYNQVRMSDDGPQDDSIAAIAFQGLTPNGASCLLELLVMGFDICNAPTTVSRLMNHVLEPYKKKKKKSLTKKSV